MFPWPPLFFYFFLAFIVIIVRAKANSYSIRKSKTVIQYLADLVVRQHLSKIQQKKEELFELIDYQQCRLQIFKLTSTNVKL